MVLDKSEKVKVLQSVPIFQDLSVSELMALSDIVYSKKYKNGETIVHEEDSQSKTFFIITAGSVNVIAYTSEGKQTILATLGSGEFFGEMSLLDGEPRSATVESDGECELLMLYRRDFLKILEQFPKITLRMLVSLSQRVRKANRHINTLSMMSVYGRVADVIMQLANDRGHREGDVVVIADPPTHQFIAEMAGTSRETVSRILAQLRKKGYIHTDRKRLVVLDEEKLYD